MHRMRQGVVRAGVVVAALSLMVACSSSSSKTPTAPATNAPSAAAQAATPAGGGVMTVLGVSKVPPGPPEPGVAELGKVPVAQRPPLPARYGDSIGNYTMAMETIASAAPSTAGLLASPGCTASSVFKRGMRVIFRFQIYDVSTGKVITDRDGADAKVALAQGNDIQAYFAPRGEGDPGPDSPWTWVAVWNVPTDYPLGALPFTVSMTPSGGQAITIKPMGGDGLPIQIVD